MESFDVKLLKRKLGSKRIHQSIRPLYGDHKWAKDLDIVNELGGHTGCVNALSGRFLASGSDDTYLNIWDYNPANQAKPFSLNTSVSTGHTANIFSVKFMPHSNDRTVVSCAGDSEVRVFDLEYSGSARTGADASARSQRFVRFFSNARWLSHENTNARVYRSHADRAKRIVTESSPYLFLSCSEDGEVRQWDLRQPSSAYPAPRGDRRGAWRRSRRSMSDVGDAPPPLISYKDYGLDLNSISCSGSQPHYIALGGAHLHCFLHDRRMLGRNLAQEQGKPAPSHLAPGSSEDESMREATKCVRRFAPNNKRSMKRGDPGHITACKISDARPNELVSSWSGDYIYSFDIIKGPDARDQDTEADELARKTRVKNMSDKKRKRPKPTDSTGSLAGATSNRRLRTASDDVAEEGRTALRMQYENGDTEMISEDADANALGNSLLNETQRQSERLAQSLITLRQLLFDFQVTVQGEDMSLTEDTAEPTLHTAVYTNVLGQASATLTQMHDVMTSWRYPVDPDSEEVIHQNTLRRNRQSAWRFVQAAGTLARQLGGTLQTPSSTQSTDTIFDKIKPAPREGTSILDKPRFCYDFLKAILAWLHGGKQEVLEVFKAPPDLREPSQRFPLSDNDTIDTFLPKIREYLISLASGEQPIFDLGKNRFERDELRQVFGDQRSAVQAFVRALEHIELRSRQGNSEVVHVGSGQNTKRIMDKGAAARFWGEKVGRSLLMTAAEGVNFSFVARAFGGVNILVVDDPVGSERGSEDEEVNTNGSLDMDIEDILMAATPLQVTVEDAAENEDHEMADQAGEADNETDDDNDNDNDNDNDDEADDVSEDSEDETLPIHRMLHRHVTSGGDVASERAKVNIDVPYTSHTKVYKGHCNTRTVKDVNYYGLDDEYVVSGSDDGHFFIWDRKTCEIVNILEGDGEVVNVVQGHPYEPMIAASGIDSTIKIFAPGRGGRERVDATRGINVANPRGGNHSSLGYGIGARRRRRTNGQDSDDESNADEITPLTVQAKPSSGYDSDEEKVLQGGLASRRVPPENFDEIQSQNNSSRRQGGADAFITRGMLMRFAAALQQREGLRGQVPGEDGGAIVVDDNCSIM